MSISPSRRSTGPAPSPGPDSVPGRALHHRTTRAIPERDRRGHHLYHDAGESPAPEPQSVAPSGRRGRRWTLTAAAGAVIAAVAVGFDYSDGWVGAVWTSPDGLTWARVPHDEAVFGGNNDHWMWSVVAGGPGLVAVGCDRSGDDENAVVWYWTPN